MVVAYRLSALTWFLVRPFIKTKFAALPNILAGRALVPELLQEAATPEALAAAVRPLLGDGAAAEEQIRVFDQIHDRLRQDYAVNAAAAVGELLQNRAGRDDGRPVSG
jgi:lipid-A-disaccharide synthase